MKLSKKFLTGFMIAIALSAVSGMVAAPVFAADSKTATESQPKFVASKQGGKYHRPECANAGRITAENKVTFKTKAAAEKAGYAACEICKP